MIMIQQNQLENLKKYFYFYLIEMILIINHYKNVRIILLKDISEAKINDIIKSNLNILNNDFIKNFLKENLLHLILQKSLILIY